MKLCYEVILHPHIFAETKFEGRRMLITYTVPKDAAFKATQPGGLESKSIDAERLSVSWKIDQSFIVQRISADGIACGGGGASDPPGGTGSIPVVAHVFVLVEENHAYGDVIGNPAMPYTNSLATRYALATQYFANRTTRCPTTSR